MFGCVRAFVWVYGWVPRLVYVYIYIYMLVHVGVHMKAYAWEYIYIYICWKVKGVLCVATALEGEIIVIITEVGHLGPVADTYVSFRVGLGSTNCITEIDF